MEHSSLHISYDAVFSHHSGLTCHASQVMLEALNPGFKSAPSRPQLLHTKKLELLPNVTPCTPLYTFTELPKE